MIRIALVDDDERYLQQMQGFINRYSKENRVLFEVSVFHDGLNFVEDYDGRQDIIFMDIEMPLMNGLDAARKIREKDSRVGIVFLTNMGQYAIKGYEVNAIDFILKPIDYFSFSDRIRRALRLVSLHAKKDIVVHGAEGELIRLNTEGIHYVEKSGNYIIYHTSDGDYTVRGTLSAIEGDLLADGFSYCSKGLLVDLRFVDKAGKDTVVVGGETLPLSRRRRPEFMADLMKYLGGTL